MAAVVYVTAACRSINGDDVETSISLLLSLFDSTVRPTKPNVQTPAFLLQICLHVVLAIYRSM